MVSLAIFRSNLSHENNILFVCLATILLINATIFLHFTTTTLQKYESFKDRLPDMGWLNEYLPDQDRVDAIKQKVQVFFRDISIPELPDAQVLCLCAVDE